MPYSFSRKPQVLPTFARVEAENVLHQEVDKYTILNFEYGQQYGKANKTDEISASLFAMNTGMLTDIRAAFEKEGVRLVKVTPPIAGMLYTCKEDVNSATRAIAVISMDFAATRLVVLHNGAPVFQQAFSSVLEDIAELFSLEFGMSKLGVLELIRDEGLGVCNKCHSAQTRKQTMTMLSNAVSEVVRSLRMVMSTMRIDIDLIVYCDTLAKLPNLANYCRQEGLSAPNENVVSLFAGGKVPPAASQAAVQSGYDPTSFITFNGLLNMPIGEANLLRGSILSDTVKENAFQIKSLAVDVQLLENECMDTELKTQLHKTREAIQYSDPMTNDSVTQLDEMIKGKVSELKYLCQSNNKAEAMQTCFKLQAYIKERNAKLLVSK